MSPTSYQNSPGSPARNQAFSLLEVILAMGIFFMSIFVILELTNNSLHGAYLLKNTAPDPRSLLGDLILTNSLEEISESGDFGDLYPDYRWERIVTQAIDSENANGLFRVDVRVYLANSDWSSDLVMLLYKTANAGGAGGSVGSPGGANRNSSSSLRNRSNPTGMGNSRSTRGSTASRFR